MDTVPAIVIRRSNQVQANVGVGPPFHQTSGAGDINRGGRRLKRRKVRKTMSEKPECDNTRRSTFYGFGYQPEGKPLTDAEVRKLDRPEELQTKEIMSMSDQIEVDVYQPVQWRDGETFAHKAITFPVRPLEGDCVAVFGEDHSGVPVWYVLWAIDAGVARLGAFLDLKQFGESDPVRDVAEWLCALHEAGWAVPPLRWFSRTELSCVAEADLRAAITRASTRPTTTEAEETKRVP